jgi:hypothetical protein
MISRGLCGHKGGREFGQRDAFGGRLFDMLDYRIVMARHRYAELHTARYDFATVPVGVAFLSIRKFGYHGGKMFVSQLAVTFLPAPRRVTTRAFRPISVCR